MRNTLLLGTLIFLLSACTCTKRPQSAFTPATPEETVRQFVEVSATAKTADDKKRLEGLCSGAMREAFEKMSAEVFRISYFNSNVKIREFKIVDTLIQGESATIQYQVSIENQQGTDPTQEINGREVGLVRTPSGWRIETIRTFGTDQVAFTRGMIF